MPARSAQEPPAGELLAKPGLLQLFLGMQQVALSSFGGGLSAWSERIVVEERRWMDDEAFITGLTVARLLPGPWLGQPSQGRLPAQPLRHMLPATGSMHCHQSREGVGGSADPSQYLSGSLRTFPRSSQTVVRRHACSNVETHVIAPRSAWCQCIDRAAIRQPPRRLPRPFARRIGIRRLRHARLGGLKPDPRARPAGLRCAREQPFRSHGPGQAPPMPPK